MKLRLCLVFTGEGFQVLVGSPKSEFNKLVAEKHPMQKKEKTVM